MKEAKEAANAVQLEEQQQILRELNKAASK